MANNRSAIQSNAYDKTISFAKQWGLKIWTASEFRYHTSRLLGKPSATAPTAAGASASAASKNNTLKALLEKEKKLSHSTNRGQDPKAALRGFHELHGHYILVEDIHQIYKTISWREYNGSPADPNFVATPNSAVMGAWPQMYLDGKENGKFLGNAFMPPDDEDEEEGENANGQNECKEGDLQGKIFLAMYVRVDRCLFDR
ncbi:hypothetical protein BDR26DRAFT_860040 [Obelidium mucronatum]|nr:hypothetical protein BDR26DRAFT_860040 [Obelidium mucronatum]